MVCKSKVFATRGVMELLGDDVDVLNEEVAEHYRNPRCGVCDEDGDLNEAALSDYAKGHGGRVLTVHKLWGEKKIWIITEWGTGVGGTDRVTTALLPEEY